MKVVSLYYKHLQKQEKNLDASLVLLSFSRLHKEDDYFLRLKEKYPNAVIALFSTAGHFIKDIIEDEEALVTVLTFEKSRVKCNSYQKEDFDSDEDLGRAIGSEVGASAKALLLISDGSLINGTELIDGINSKTKRNIAIVGGMAGDGKRFEETLVGLNEEPGLGRVAAITIHGDDLMIFTNHDMAWTSLGLEFIITKAEKNQLFELNNKNAYEILREFMYGKDEKTFTENVLYYPFFLEDGENEGVIRTPIAIDHENKVLTYAGNMPIGAKVRLMKSRTMQLLDSVMNVATESHKQMSQNQFVLAISCVGRRVVLDELANEEYTELFNVFGDQSAYFGFYSYGEFSRSGFEQNCKLHNQTLTLALISEK